MRRHVQKHREVKVECVTHSQISHTQKFLHTATFYTHINLYTRTLLHTDTCSTLFTHEGHYRQTLVHTNAEKTQPILHTGAYANSLKMGRQTLISKNKQPTGFVISNCSEKIQPDWIVFQKAYTQQNPSADCAKGSLETRPRCFPSFRSNRKIVKPTKNKLFFSIRSNPKQNISKQKT